MKILYLSKADHIDYQDDCLTIGLKELFGANVVDYNKREHIYTSYNKDINKLYGKGMTVTKVIEDLPVDRTDITNKIKNKYFDYIVYGSIWRCSSYINEILKYYPKNRVIVVDGEDETNLHSTFDLGLPYFKRELIYSNDTIFPISFALPTNKLDFSGVKKKDIAFINPCNRSTYIYNNEQDYYNDYKEARFAITTRKAGWDCMRHYEILGNGCIPLFYDIDKCPDETLTYFPKKTCKVILEEYSTTDNKEDVYNRYKNIIKQHTRERLTTQFLAQKFMDTLISIQ